MPFPNGLARCEQDCQSLSSNLENGGSINHDEQN
jgi:hypothetical protein